MSSGIKSYMEKKSYDMIPRKTKKIDTKYRRICTDIPVPESASVIEKLRKYEPRSMSGQPLVIWDRAEGINVFDRYGNKWIDFSSGVLVTNSGHTNPEVQAAILNMVSHGLLHNYCFPTEIRANLVEALVENTPDYLEKCFLLTTGGESTECAIKLMRTWGGKRSGGKKIKIITFENDFHGRTMGAQMAGGSPGGKAWIVNQDPDMHVVPFPNAFLYDWADESRPDFSDDKCFAEWKKHLDRVATPDTIAGFMPETFQGGWVQLMPKGFVQRLRKFCDENEILLTFDEVQAGFSRSGKFFAYEHYGVKADLVCCGKGISSSLPLSCVLGRADVMDQYGPNDMTSTHTGNPVCAAAALANLKYMVKHDLASRATELGKVAEVKLRAMQKKYPCMGFVSGTGLAWAIVFTKPGTKEQDNDLAHDVVRNSIENGLLFFAPVGSGATIKVTPPLIIEEEALLEGLEVFEEAIAEALAERK